MAKTRKGRNGIGLTKVMQIQPKPRLVFPIGLISWRSKEPLKWRPSDDSRQYLRENENGDQHAVVDRKDAKRSSSVKILDVTRVIERSNQDARNQESGQDKEKVNSAPQACSEECDMANPIRCIKVEPVIEHHHQDSDAPETIESTNSTLGFFGVDGWSLHFAVLRSLDSALCGQGKTEIEIRGVTSLNLIRRSCVRFLRLNQVAD